MYPDFSYILHALLGTEPDGAASIIKTFGLFLALAFLASAYVLSLELRRKEREGILKPTIMKAWVGRGPNMQDILMNALFGFLLGFKGVYIFQHFEELVADAGGLLLSSKGSWIGGILGAVLLGAYKYWEAARARLPEPKQQAVKIYPHERVGDITMVAAVSGIAGAKIFALVENLDAFFADPIGEFFSGSGMSVYGGLILGVIVGLYYVRRMGIPPMQALDAAAPAMIMGYAVGRLGCHFSGDGDWGIVNELAKPGWLAFLPDYLWSFDYPHNVLKEGVPIEGCTWLHCNRLSPGVFPTPIYETFMASCIFILLWALRKRLSVVPGLLFFVYVFLNGFERFWIEKIRVNRVYEVMGIQSTQAEFIAVLLMVIGLVGLGVLWRRYKSMA